MAELFKEFGKVLSVRIRRTKEKKPKGSSFIEFSTPEEAKAAVAATTKVGDVELIKYIKSDYTQLKKQKKQDFKKRKADKNENDQDEEKGNGKKQKKENGKDEEEKKHPKGVLLRFKGIGDGVTREILKDIFGKYGDIAFVDFSQNEVEGIIRFKEPESSVKAIADIKDSKVEIGSKVPELSLLQEEEEEAYWKKLTESRRNAKGKHSTRGKKRRRF